MSIEGFLADAESTDELGAVLALTRPATAVVYLQGDLGAGKSALARALLRALGVRGAIRSPTYTLVERYGLADGSEARHLDLYRIGDAGELDFLGLDDVEASLWLVEWPERGAGCLPANDIVVQLRVEGEGRRFWLLSNSEGGKRWLERVADALKM